MSHQSKSTAYGYLSCLLATLLVGAILRCQYLDERSIWFDEASSWQTARMSFRQMLESLTRSTHVPLYYPLLRAWMYLFGETPVAIRSFSVALGLLTVVACHWLGRMIYSVDEEGDSGAGGWFGVACALTCALCASQVHASVEARMYSLGTFLFVTSQCSVLWVDIEPDSWLRWSIFTLGCIAQLYTHHFLAMNVFISLAWLLVRHFVRFRFEPESRLLDVGFRRKFFSSIVVILLVWLPGVILFWVQFTAVRDGFWINQPTFWTVPETIAEFFVGTTQGLRPLPFIVTLPVTLLVALTLFRQAVVCRGAIGLMLLQGLIPMVAVWLVSIETPIWETRYFRFCSVALLIVIVKFLWRRHWLHRLICLSIFSTVLLLGTISFWWNRDIPNRQAVRGAMEYIAAQHDDLELDSIVVTRPMDFVVVRFYAPRFGFRRDQVFVHTGEQRRPGFAHHLIRDSDWWVTPHFSRDIWIISGAGEAAQDSISPMFESDLHLDHWSVRAGRVSSTEL